MACRHASFAHSAFKSGLSYEHLIREVSQQSPNFWCLFKKIRSLTFLTPRHQLVLRSCPSFWEGQCTVQRASGFLLLACFCLGLPLPAVSIVDLALPRGPDALFGISFFQGTGPHTNLACLLQPSPLSCKNHEDSGGEQFLEKDARQTVP